MRGKAQGETFPKWGPGINCCLVLRPHIVGKTLPWGFTLTLKGGIGRLKRPWIVTFASTNSARAWAPSRILTLHCSVSKAWESREAGNQVREVGVWEWLLHHLQCSMISDLQQFLFCFSCLLMFYVKQSLWIDLIISGRILGFHDEYISEASVGIIFLQIMIYRIWGTVFCCGHTSGWQKWHAIMMAS